MTTCTRRAARRQPSLMVLGDLLLEVAVMAVRPVQQSTDVPGTMLIRRGGSAANVAVAFAALGGRASFIGSVGRDGIGARLTAAVRNAGVAVHVVRVDVPTARLLALIAGDGERSFVTERAAADRLRPEDLKAAWFRGVGALHIPGYSLYAQPVADAAVAAVRHARARHALISIDLSSRAPMLAFGRERTWELLAQLSPDVLFANASEAAALTGGGEPGELLRVALAAVVKEGPEGCRVLWRDPGSRGGTSGQLRVATVPIAAADTTGAGDAFAAGFLAELLRSAAPASTGADSARVPSGHDSGVAWGTALARRAARSGHAAAVDLLRGTREELQDAGPRRPPSGAHRAD